MANDSFARGRLLALSGAVNFRDVGGYAAADGRTIKWNQLFRSDSLAELSDADLLQFDALGLNTLVDLRHESERQTKPNRLSPASRVRTHAIGFHPAGSDAMRRRVRRREMSAVEARDFFHEMYRRLPIDQAPIYASLLQLLLEPAAFPALVHCTSGKDRTGFGIASVLLALGVPRETILQDYELTNRYRRDLGFMFGPDADPEVVDVIRMADAGFMRCAFASIDEHWGGDDAFVEHGLGLSSARRRQLQDLLLERASIA